MKPLSLKWRTLLLFLAVLLMAGIFSCQKILDEWKGSGGGSHDKFCQVASYGPGYDTFFHLPYPFFFQVGYSASGKQAQSISLYFDNLVYPPDLPHFNLTLKEKGRQLLVYDVNHPGSPVMTAYLNTLGRVDSFHAVSFSDFPPDYGAIERTVFLYQNNRLAALNYGAISDSCYYDTYGNLLAIKRYDSWLNDYTGLFYQYDYSRQPAQQYYKFSLVLNNGFQLLQYLGYFPEINRPKHLAIHVKEGIESTAGGATFNYDLFDHQFDDKGRLSSFKVGWAAYPAGAPEYHITWNCR